MQAALRDTPVVFLQGPRQAGKTTLVQSLKEDGHGAAYFTFDDAAVLAAAQSDPDGFVANLPNKVILDDSVGKGVVPYLALPGLDRRRTPSVTVTEPSASNAPSMSAAPGSTASEAQQ